MDQKRPSRGMAWGLARAEPRQRPASRGAWASPAGIGTRARSALRRERQEMNETKPRAPKGTGRVFEKSTGWHAQWSSRDPATGTRRQHKKGPFRSEREARKYITQQI